jgi:hypothetical protein
MSEYRVRIWHKYYDDYPEQPDEVVTVEEGTPHLWKDDPYFDSGPCAFDIHPEDAPGTLNIYTNDSVRRPHVQENHVDESIWDGPIERGLEFDPERYDDYPPFGCEVWGRVLFMVDGNKN